MSERVTKAEVEGAYRRLCNALRNHGANIDDLRLEHNSVYGWSITNAAGSAHPFGMRSRTARAMYDVIDFATDVLHLTYRQGRARFDVVGYPTHTTERTRPYTDVGYHDALMLCEKLNAETGYSHYIEERPIS